MKRFLSALILAVLVTGCANQGGMSNNSSSETGYGTRSMNEDWPPSRDFPERVQPGDVRPLDQHTPY